MVEWIRNLPEVGDPLLKRIESIRLLEQEARACEREALLKRHRACLDALVLETEVHTKWTPEEIRKARAALAVPS